MRTPIASEAAADCKLVKQVSQKFQEKRCADCREGKLGLQGNYSQYLSAAFKTGIEISVWGKVGELEVALWKAGAPEHKRDERKDERSAPALRFRPK
jgi:hypothetical protein